MKTQFILLLSIFIFLSCENDSANQASGYLKKLPQEEVIQLKMKGTFDCLYAEFFNEDGNKLTDDEKDLLNSGEMTKDFYVDETGVVRRAVVRKAQLADKFYEIRFGAASPQIFEKITFKEIDCGNQKAILEELYEKDQGSRTGNIENSDLENQDVLVSLIEKCGFPDIGKVGSRGIDGAFFVLQHSNPGLMAYYFPYMVKAVEKGHIKATSFALMQDRLLMWNGYKQIFGTQIQNGSLYEIEDPLNVNLRREEIGLGTIEEYIAFWDLDFETELNRMIGK